MTNNYVRPPFENALHSLWVSSKLRLPPRFALPVRFDTSSLVDLLANRGKWRIDIDNFTVAMTAISAVEAASQGPHRRRIALAGQPFLPGYRPPYLAFHLA